MKLHPRAIVRLSIVLALAFWLLDSCIHYFLYREPTFQIIPQDLNELWMRALICLLIVSLGVTIARSGTIPRPQANAGQADASAHGGDVNVTLVRLHMLARRVETGQLTPEEFYALAKAAIQPAVQRWIAQG
ncbi:MAG: hypothetical protein GTO41_28195 [Burkholderiales bacterium]|nr:hypothetical protein [Burkholderiales bacterium]